MTAPAPHENHISKAFEIGYEDGIQGFYQPLPWMHGNPLWIVAYQNGNTVGRRERQSKFLYGKKARTK